VMRRLVSAAERIAPNQQAPRTDPNTPESPVITPADY
jgi:hypothetical protein